MSSGAVSARTRSTGPALAAITASSAVNAIRPTAAPGEAGSPVAILFKVLRDAGAITGCSNWSSCIGSTRRMASFLSMRPSFTMSTAIFTAAGPVRLPLRVCNMYSLPSWIVNSKS